MPRLRLVLLATAWLLVSLVGCHSAPPAAGPWRLALVTTPAVPSSDADTQFRLQVNAASGAPLVGATATLDLAMATMDMGTTRVTLAPRGSGVYVGVGRFAMDGDWNCQATITLGGRTQTQVFHYKVG